MSTGDTIFTSVVAVVSFLVVRRYLPRVMRIDRAARREKDRDDA